MSRLEPADPAGSVQPVSPTPSRASGATPTPSPASDATPRPSCLSPQLPSPSPRLLAVVVVPARDEAERIEACLRALAAQRELAPDRYEALIVLDRCRDETAQIVARFAASTDLRLHPIELDDCVGVGEARRRGMDLACERLHAVRRPRGLIASTDADTVVAPDWLARQLALIAGGAEAIGGFVALDETEASAIAAAVAERDRRAHARLAAVLASGSDDEATSPLGTGVRAARAPALVEHHHFSGASLALTAAAYRRCGGLPARVALEDEALEARLRACGIQIDRARDVRVRTSARLDGRAPRGLARDLAASDWRARRCHEARSFPLELLLERKRCSISLVLPSRRVAATIGAVASAAASLRDAGLLDEVLVIDAGSREGDAGDRTAELARAAGVDVLDEDALAPELGPCRGKGDAMWRGLRASAGEIVAFADTDTEGFGTHFLTGLLGPLVCDPQIEFVKGSFRRPFRVGGEIDPHGGGRVTELTARPLLNLHAPELAVFDQPLAGETAARRALLEQVPFSAGYGVEIGLLIDCWRRVGIDAMAQVDLGVRQNRHQPLRDLSGMAYAVLAAAHARLGRGEDDVTCGAAGSIVLPPLRAGQATETRPVAVEERPPLASLLCSGA